MPFLYSSLVVAAATPPALLALFHVHTKLFMATRKAVFTLAVPESFLASRHLRIINPRQHMIATDAVTLKIRRPLGMSDEELLARFARGFFGRRTFMVERTFFRIIGLRMVGFTAIDKTVGRGPTALFGAFRVNDNNEHANMLWIKSQLSRNRIPPLGTVFYGGFQVLDKEITPASASAPRSSFVDIGFGSDTATFAGSHRFEVITEENVDPKSDGADGVDGHGDSGDVVVKLSHFRCNPLQNKPSGAEWIRWFHIIYAKMLFNDGIGEILAK